MEKAVNASPALAANWQKLRDERAKAHAKFVALEKEYANMSQEFVKQSQALLMKYEVPDDKQQQFLKQITNLCPLESR